MQYLKLLLYEAKAGSTQQFEEFCDSPLIYPEDEAMFSGTFGKQLSQPILCEFGRMLPFQVGWVTRRINVLTASIWIV